MSDGKALKALMAGLSSPPTNNQLTALNAALDSLVGTVPRNALPALADTATSGVRVKGSSILLKADDGNWYPFYAIRSGNTTTMNIDSSAV